MLCALHCQERVEWDSLLDVVQQAGNMCVKVQSWHSFEMTYDGVQWQQHTQSPAMSLSQNCRTQSFCSNSVLSAKERQQVQEGSIDHSVLMQMRPHACQNNHCHEHQQDHTCADTMRETGQV